MSLRIRHRFAEIVVRIRLVLQRPAYEAWELAVVAVVEDGLKTSSSGEYQWNSAAGKSARSIAHLPLSYLQGQLHQEYFIPRAC